MVKIEYSDALGDSHTFMKSNEKEAIDWLEKGKYPHGAIFNVKINGKLYKKQMKDSKFVYDKAIRMMDAEEEQWITVNGSHIKINEEGEPVAGNKELINKLNKAENNMSKGNKNYEEKSKKIDTLIGYPPGIKRKRSSSESIFEIETSEGKTYKFDLSENKSSINKQISEFKSKEGNKVKKQWVDDIEETIYEDDPSVGTLIDSINEAYDEIEYYDDDSHTIKRDFDSKMKKILKKNGYKAESILLLE